MGIFTGLFKSRDKPQNRTAGSSYTFFMGSSTSGKAVTERSAMQMTAVYSCVRILAEAVAGLPLHVYKYNGNGGKEKAVEHPLYHLLHDEPNPEMSSFVFRETLMTHLLLWGNAYAQIIRNGKGEIIALYPLMPNRMSVDRDTRGKLYYKYTTSAEDAPTMEGSTAILSPADVLHIPGLGFDGLVGYSPIAMAKNAIGMAIACEEFGAKFFANGAAPSGVLEHPGTIKDPSRVREAWQSQFGGSSNSGKVAVLEEGMKYTPISISPEQAQFLETRKFQINEIARIFRVPPHMVGDLEKSSFSNIEQQSLEFVKYTLDPWLVRWEQSIFRALFSTEEKESYFVKFNVEGLLRGDYATRMNGYATARQNGWMSANDIRELENLDRIPGSSGGDLYLINGNESWRWHCNNKFMKREHCQTPTLKEQSLEECFVAAFNSILARKEEIAANYAECLDAITDDSALKARMEDIQQETADITTLINNLLMNGSKQRGGGEDTNVRYEQYMSRHEALQQEKLELAKKISLLSAKRLVVNAFLAELAKYDGPLTAFDPLVFQATVNYVTVNEDCTVTFLFRDGTETTQTIEKGVRQYVRRQPKADSNLSTDDTGGK